MLNNEKTVSNKNDVLIFEDIFKTLELLLPLKKKLEKSKGAYQLTDTEKELWAEVVTKVTRYLEKSENLNPLVELATQDLTRVELERKLELLFKVDLGIRAKTLKKSTDEFPNPIYEMIFCADVSVGNIQTKTPQVISILEYLRRNIDLKYFQNMLRAEPDSDIKISGLQQAFDRGNKELAGVIFETLAQTAGEKIKLLKSIKQDVQPNIFPFLLTKFCNLEVETKLLNRALKGKFEDFIALFGKHLYSVNPEVWQPKITEIRHNNKIFKELESTFQDEKFKKLQEITQILDSTYYDSKLKEVMGNLTAFLEKTQADFRVNLNVVLVQYLKKLPLLTVILEKGNIDLAIKLIDLGVNVNLADHEGETPLHFAVKNKLVNLVKKLIAAGADVNLCNKKMESPLYIACQCGLFEIVKVLLSSGAVVNQQNGEHNKAPLHIAATRGYLNILRELIEFGADISLENKVKNTALHYAAESGHIDIIKELIAAGDNINHQGHEGATALILANRYKSSDAAKFLIEAGADVNITDEFGNTAIYYAIKNGLSKDVILLIQKGATITDKDIKLAGYKEQQITEYKERELTKENKELSNSFSEVVNILKILKNPQDLQAQFAFAISLAAKTDPLSSSYFGAFSPETKAKIASIVQNISEIVVNHVNETIKPGNQTQERQL